MSIQDKLGKIKPKQSLPHIETVTFNDQGEIESRNAVQTLFLPVVLILVVSLAFGLGRLSKGKEVSGIKIEYDPTIPGAYTSEIPASKPSDNQTKEEATSQPISSVVVGSIKGTKYHYLYCPGAKQISEANKVTFKNAAAAEAAGYTLALNCKPK